MRLCRIGCCLALALSLSSSLAYAQIVGSPVETGPQRPSQGGPADRPTVANGPGGWLTAWSTRDGARRALLRADGTLAEPAPLTTGGYPNLVGTGLGAGGDSWLAMWESNVGGTLSGYELWSGSGELLFRGTHTLEGYFHVASDGQQFLVVAEVPSHQEIVHVDAAGALTTIESIGDAGGNGIDDFNVVWDGGRFVVAYPNDSGSIAIRDYDASGAPRSSSTIDASASAVRAASRGSGETLVVWSGSTGLTGAAVLNDGSVMPTTLDLPGERQSTYWDVGWDGSSYLIAHQSPERALVGTRIGTDGAVLDPTPFALVPAEVKPFRVAVGDGDAGTALVVFEPYVAISEPCRQYPVIYAVRVAGGAPLEPTPQVVSAGGNAHAEPALYRAGSDLLLVHTDFADLRSTAAAMHVIVDTPLQVGASVDIFAGQDPASIRDAAGRSDGQGLIVAKDCTGGVTARRFDATGLVDPPIVLPATVGSVDVVEVATDDSGYLVVWGKHGASTLEAASVAGDGTLLDAAPIPIDTASTLGDIDVVFHRGRYVIITGDSDKRDVIPVDSNGVSGTPSTLAGYPLIVSSNATDTVLVQQNGYSSDYATYARFLGDTNTPAEPGVKLEQLPYFDAIVAVGPLGSGFLIVYRTAVGEAEALAAMHVLPSGTATPEFFLRIGGELDLDGWWKRPSFAGLGKAGVLAYTEPVVTDHARVMRTLLQRVELLCDGRADGDSCDDGQECTGDDACQGGVCVGDYLDGCGVAQPPDAGAPPVDAGTEPVDGGGPGVARGGSSSNDGCGCRVPAASQAPMGWLAALVSLLGVALLRRRPRGPRQRRNVTVRVRLPQGGDDHSCARP